MKPRKYSKASSTRKINFVLCRIDPRGTMENGQAVGGGKGDWSKRGVMREESSARRSRKAKG